ncbi:effector-associated constant component EACC1 [Streptomyces aidingensis]|uniref:Uncharacterized protein n=1 Tax=Streptomyces aidingensis TaxID=910347 RepID=A0A1I1K0V0_9ACTN|nr:hypothetical protein [Streptomyces aidingensis]SFC54376.1 hypothetical protein SAMN05421773_10437 [Streptomyces aidingensis]
MSEEPANAAAAAGPMTVRLAVAPDPALGLDAGETERLTGRLRAELLELEVASVETEPAGELPDGAGAGDPVTVGAVVVALGAGGGAFVGLVEMVRDWLGRQAARHRISLTVDGDTIELERASEEERRELISAYIHRHSDGRRPEH